MTKWNELVAIDCSFLLQKINRKPEVLAAYHRCREQPGWQESTVDRFTHLLGQQDHILTENEFPYDLEHGISHMLLWFHADRPMQEVKAIACKELREDEHDVVVCCNAPDLKTIPEISHYHVFVRHSSPMRREKNVD